MNHRSRREFLADVGRGMLVASVGVDLAGELGASRALADEGDAALSFGALEPLVLLLQETTTAQLVPVLVKKLQGGGSLRDLTAAAALANARTFGGEDYVGFHTLMALAPAYRMAFELPEALRPLPILKVLYRNTSRIQEHGGRAGEVLHGVAPADDLPADRCGGEVLRDAVRAKDVEKAERVFARLAQGTAKQAFNDLLLEVQDATEVHRVVLPYRAWDLLDIIGLEHAHTLLRQSVRYCVKSEKQASPGPYNATRDLLPRLLDQHRLLGREVGTRPAEDAWVDRMSQALFKATPSEAADAVAAALAEGFSPADVGEAISLAANQLVLRDHGRREREVQPGKPLGSVHGDSIGVHACDSANAWRNMTRSTDARNTYASLICGAYQVAFDRVNRGGDFLQWPPQPSAERLAEVRETSAAELLAAADAAIRANDQASACAVAHRHCELGFEARGLFDLLLRHATSEDGALHAEKYYRTVSEEFAATRPAFRSRQLVALARVTASEYGRPAPGVTEAREALGL